MSSGGQCQGSLCWGGWGAPKKGIKLELEKNLLQIRILSISDHWQHDKFHQGLLTPEKEEDMKAFGTHWSKIRYAPLQSASPPTQTQFSEIE